MIRIVVVLLHFSLLTIQSLSFSFLYTLKSFQLPQSALKGNNGFYNRDMSLKMIASASNKIGTSEDVKTKELLHIELNDELKTSFMSYAMSTILSRALPDAVFRLIVYDYNIIQK